MSETFDFLSIFKALTEELASEVLAAGGCDHSCGVCSCEQQRLLGRAQNLLALMENGKTMPFTVPTTSPLPSPMTIEIGDHPGLEVVIGSEQGSLVIKTDWLRVNRLGISLKLRAQNAQAISIDSVDPIYVEPHQWGMTVFPNSEED